VTRITSSSAVGGVLSGLPRYFLMRSPSLLSSLTQSSAAFAMSMTVRGLPVLASSMVTLTREAASQQGACQVMLRVARVHDYQLAVKFDAVEAIIANALLALWRMQPRKGFWLNPHDSALSRPRPSSFRFCPAS